MINPAHPSNLPMAERGYIPPPQASGAGSQSRLDINGNHPIAAELAAMWQQIDRMNRMMYQQHSLSNAAGTVQHIRHTDEFLMREGYLVDDLPKAEDPLSDPGIARMQAFAQFGIQSANGGELLGVQNEYLWVVNRSKEFEAKVDDYVVVAYFNGEWRPMTSSPSEPGGGLIRFQIIDVDCEERVADAIVMAVPCPNPFDVEVGDQIEVYDKAGCLFDVDPVLLQDRIGYAAYMSNTETSDENPYYYGYPDDCIWEAITLCVGVSSCGPLE